MTINPSESLLSTRQLALRLNLNTQYVRDLARLGVIPSYKIGTSWRFSYEEVKRKLEQNSANAVERSLATTAS